MTLSDSTNVVFDCNVFAQALISPRGPAAACVAHAQLGRLVLFVSDYVLQEIRELPQKLKPQLGVSPELIERFIQDIAKYARVVDDVPNVYTHPHDPDDSHYVNLAVATESQLIVSRDRHLLNLMDTARPEGKEFKKLFPALTVLTPDVFANQLRAG
ncbi:MAG TPA: putative toxin-antitoxin system toxin component, PIN family [Humisphaera sp.]|jgi:putative PIN family toxin of toxin-antitoxin system|nr:putative toxin-antitoxin system toxin component, PIN family [Humisphaera sp.]